jgi:two-component system, OmpR family, KDP operon response regulator KdpE
MVPVTNRRVRLRAPVLPRVLLVEDDRRGHQLLRQILIRVGWEVISATTLAGGLARIGCGLDCVLLDLGLPDGGGEAILEKIRSARLAVRVAVMTAEGDPARLRRVAALEPDLFMSKPIDLPELIGWLELAAPRVRGTAQLVGSMN